MATGGGGGERRKIRSSDKIDKKSQKKKKKKKNKSKRTDIHICTYPTSNSFGPKLAHRFHHTPLLINDILNPIRPPRRNENMRCPAINPAIQLIRFVNAESPRILDSAAVAVFVAIFAVDGRVDFGEER